MRFNWIEVPEEVQWEPRPLLADEREDLPQDTYISTPPQQVFERRYRPGGRTERRPSGIHRPAGVRVSNVSVGNAMAIAVQHFHDEFDQRAIQWSINNALREKWRIVQMIMSHYRHGGLLAVATIIVRYDPSFSFGLSMPGAQPVRNSGPRSRQLSGVSIENGVYALPQHAIQVWKRLRNTQAQIGPGVARVGEYLERRFFWGRWNSP